MAMSNMNLGAQPNVYKQNAATTASPGELTLMLYNGILKFTKRARQAMDEKDVQGRNEALQRAQAIISELLITLKVEDETTENMARLYEYINYQLIQANVKNDPAFIDEAEQYVIRFRDTWKEVIQQERKRKYGGGV
ncbi:flagellar export chaperone FliS [Salsuginibacillus kocurii]|uniref:flagellar export chaperone FliS n=1 Tax=Salsuginibacillus kocurii TaxID=427078 RepID=UPI0003676977|nr:flagellar export chaperone FliS [Salsuginibacillus kocurii]